jgi:hypothetical protein
MISGQVFRSLRPDDKAAGGTAVADPAAMDDQVSWLFRRQTLASSESLLRILREAVADYGGDVEGVIIYLAISCASVGSALKNPALTALTEGDMPESWFRPTSRRAIAASTGLPRETVRRKVGQFLEAGLLVQAGAGVCIPRQLLNDPVHHRFAACMIAEFTRAAQQLKRLEERAKRGPALSPEGAAGQGRAVG